MSIFFWVFVVVILSGTGIFVLRLLKRKPHDFSLLTPVDSVNLTVNLVMLAFTLVSIAIALAAYQDSKNSGKQQEKSLQESRDSLQAVVGALSTQTALLNDAQNTLKSQLDVSRQQQRAMVSTNNVLQSSRNTLKSQLDISDAQNKRELEKLNKRPSIHFSFGEAQEEKFVAGAYLPIEKAGKLALKLKNTGDAALSNPTLLITVVPDSVSIFGPGPVWSDGEKNNRFQLSGPNIINQIEPSSQIGSDYECPFRLVIPDDVSVLTLTFSIYGSNLPVHLASIPLTVFRTPVQKK